MIFISAADSAALCAIVPRMSAEIRKTSCRKQWHLSTDSSFPKCPCAAVRHCDNSPLSTPLHSSPASQNNRRTTDVIKENINCPKRLAPSSSCSFCWPEGPKSNVRITRTTTAAPCRLLRKGSARAKAVRGIISFLRRAWPLVKLPSEKSQHGVPQHLCTTRVCRRRRHHPRRTAVFASSIVPNKDCGLLLMGPRAMSRLSTKRAVRSSAMS